MSEAELARYLNERKTRRAINIKRKSKRLTAKSLAKAWGVKESLVIRKVLELYDNDNEGNA